MSKASGWVSLRPGSCEFGETTIAVVTEDGLARLMGWDEKGEPVALELSEERALKIARWILATFGEEPTP